jgi:hypothetical protein
MCVWRTSVLLLGLVWLPQAVAQDYVRIGNRLKPGQYLHVERGSIASGEIERHWWSAQWRLPPVPGTEFFWIINRAKSVPLHVVRGESSWAVEPVPGMGYVRLRNRERSGEYLHMVRGALQSGPVPAALASSHWILSERWPVDSASGEVEEIRRSRIRNRISAGGWHLEQVGDLEFFRVGNPGTPDFYIHLESGRLQFGRIEPGWWSAQWKMERIEGSGFFLLRNRAREGELLYFRDGGLASGAVGRDERAQWSLVDPLPPSPSTPAPASTPPELWHGPGSR